MNLCFVGCGAIAAVHADICRRLGHTFHAAVGRTPASAADFAREWKFSHHTDRLEEALEHRDIDAVLICSPSEEHETQARCAIDAGRHVLVELPLAMSYAAGAAMAELSDRRGVTVMVAHTQRFMPAVQAVREEVAAGRLHLHHILARFLFFRRRHVGWTGRPRSWADNLLWHHACHVVDTCLWLLGMPPVDGLDVRGRIGPRYPATGIPMDLDITFAVPGETLVNIGMSYHSEETGLDYLMIGEERTLRITRRTLLHGVEVLYDGERDVRYIANALQDREFFAAIAERRPPAVGITDVLRMLQLVHDQNPAS